MSVKTGAASRAYCFTMLATSTRPSPGRRLRRVAPILAAALTALLAPAAAQESRTIRLAVGASATIALSENPSTGYRWQLNTDASRNLALIAVSNAGFTAGASGRLGAPGMRRFIIAARQGGTAVAVFDHTRPWEHAAPARRHSVTVEIGGR